MGRTLAVACLLAVVAAACGGDDDGDGDAGLGAASTTTTAGTEAPTTSSGELPPLADVALTLTEVAEAETPMALVSRTGTDTLYVAEREGRVRTLGPDGTLGDPIVDISDEVVTASEQGLLDIEFSDDGATLYLHYSLDPSGDTRVISYAVEGDVVDTASRRELLAVEQPFDNHNGGDIEIGPDGYLYVALGDGGSAGDPEGNGQNTQALLGKVLRLDPAATTGDDYGIPADNPFADGAAGAPEVWSYGVRNPWRIAFDAETDDLWVADVGQNAYEEIDVLPAAEGGGWGANLGWNEMEGTHPYEGGSNPAGAVLPVFEYGHGEGGCSITGGVVYRGAAIPALDGAYLFTDYCMSRLRAIRVADGEVVDRAEFEASGSNLISFGTDAASEVYVLSENGPIYRLEAA